MKCRYLVIALLTILVAPPLSASEIDFDASLSVEILSRNAIDVQLRLTNRSNRNVCFFLQDSWPVLLAKDGTHLPVTVTGIEIPILAKPNEVQVVWNDGRQHDFEAGLGLNRPYQTPATGDDIAKITYDLTAYDCATLFAHSYHSAKPLLSRHLSDTPTNGPLHNLTLPPMPR